MEYLQVWIPFGHEQGYKELREYFAFGKEENRIYEALIARITLSFISYNIVSYINRINHEPQTLGGLFKDLECELIVWLSPWSIYTDT